MVNNYEDTYVSNDGSLLLRQDLLDQLPTHEERVARRRGQAIGNVYIAFSVLTLGLPQTAKHFCSKTMDLLIRDGRQGIDRYNAMLDISEIACTGALMVGQVIAMRELYSWLYKTKPF